jgi:hypothetical protein
MTAPPNARSSHVKAATVVQVQRTKTPLPHWTTLLSTLYD